DIARSEAASLICASSMKCLAWPGRPRGSKHSCESVLNTMTNATLFFAAIGVIAMGCQWLAWRFRIPAIILLLGVGLLVGPATGFLAPAKVLGPLIRPLIAAAVAIILFEGGLSL